MNKKQLIVAWVIGIFLTISFLIFPYAIRKEKLYRPLTEIEKKELEPRKPGVVYFDDRSIWTGEYKFVIKERKKGKYLPYFCQVIPPIVIIGGLLIYTLRNKKK